jgi:hypothetical protein
MYRAPCGCPAEGDDRVTLTAHLPGCGFLEDLATYGACLVSEPETTAPAEPGPAERALAATYERYAAELAAIEAMRAAPPAN